MYNVMKEIPVLAVMAFAISSYVLSSSEFKVTYWNVCPQNVAELRTLVGISLYECIVSCSKRTNCEYIVYRRRGAVCHIIRYLDINTSIKRRIGCVVVSRKDISTSMLADECFCNEEQVCNNGMCRYEECSFPTISNGVTLGNTNAVGSSLKISCEATFTEINRQTAMECQHSGLWDYYPTCASVIECDELTVANGELVGTDNSVGAVRTIVCKTGYVEELGKTEVRCDGSGNWDYTPACRFECDELTFANGELVGTDNSVGAVRTIVCNTGFVEELGKTEVRCDGSGNWDYTPVCRFECRSNSEYSKQEFHIKVFNSKSKTKSRDEANDYCTREGGSLVKINEPWKMEFVADLLRTCSIFSNHEFWTDGKGYDDAWRFLDNTRVPMTNEFWHQDKPDEKDQCARLVNKNGAFLWDDSRCGNDMKFICEY